jgi:hypothetical protein
MYVGAQTGKPSSFLLVSLLCKQLLKSNFLFDAILDGLFVAAEIGEEPRALR